MLVAYVAPTVSNIAISGASWLTADAGAACVDGKPARRSRINSAGAAQITLTHAAAFKPRVIAVLGLRGVAAGAIISATTGAGAALGGNSASQPVVRFADGTFGAWIVTAGTVSTATVRVTIAAAGAIDIGELVALPAVEVAAQPDWVDELVDPTETRLSLGAQPLSTPRQSYRRLAANLTSAAVGEVRGGGLADGMDWDHLRAALAGDRPCAAATRYQDGAGAVDAVALNRSACFGTGRLGPTAHLGGDWYGAAFSLTEAPAMA